MSDNHAADAQDAKTAAREDTSSVADTIQRKPQGATAARTGADEGDYEAQRNAFLTDEEGFLKENTPDSPVTEKPAVEEVDETLEDEAEAASPVESDPVAEEPDEAEDADESGASRHKRKHVNLARLGEEKSKLVLFLDKNPDVPLGKAIEILKLKLSPEDAKGDASPTSIEEVEARIEQLWDERTKAFGDDLDFKKAADLDREIAKLQKQAGSLREQELHARQTGAIQFQQEVTESRRKAMLYYPDCTVKDSPLLRKMVEIDRLLEETGDERYNNPDKPFLVAKLAAKELGIAPRDPKKPSAAPVKSPSPAPARTVASPVQPAPGNQRTQATQTREGALDELVDSIRDEDDYEAARKKFLVAV